MIKETEVACQLLKLEQQLKAYQKLHGGELAELWQSLEACKSAIAQIELRKGDTESTIVSAPPASVKPITIEPRKGE